MLTARHDDRQGADEELARKFHDDAAVWPLPEKLAARTLALLTLRASQVSLRC